MLLEGYEDILMGRHSATFPIVPYDSLANIGLAASEPIQLVFLRFS